MIEIDGRGFLSPTFWEKIKHIFGRHRYAFYKRLSRDADMIVCTICKKKFAMSHSVKTVLEWDQELEDMYAMFDSLERKDSDCLEKINDFKRKYKRY